jgi:hypothetical protein
MHSFLGDDDDDDDEVDGNGDNCVVHQSCSDKIALYDEGNKRELVEGCRVVDTCR